MSRLLARVGRIVTALVFVGALGFGASQAVVGNQSVPCDTEPGSCTIDDDCDQACALIGKNNGGQCQEDDNCCVCFD